MSHSDIAITRRITTAEQTEARLAPLGLQKFVIAECEYRTLPSVRYPVAATPPAFWSSRSSDTRHHTLTFRRFLLFLI